jgi:molybdopterin-guanine dinucleotide biosynthesis protein MobB
MHELCDTPEETLEALLMRMAPVDLLLIEGWKLHPNPRMEVYRKANGKPLLYPDNDHIIAIASDSPLDTTLPRFGIDDYDRIAQFVLESTGLK